MMLSKNQVLISIKSRLHKLEDHLSSRVQSLLEEIVAKNKGGSDEVDLFDLLVQLILSADKDPASLIANLMVPLDNEAASQLEEWTLSSAGAFLKDYLKRDYILYILNSIPEERNKIRQDQ